MNRHEEVRSDFGQRLSQNMAIACEIIKVSKEIGFPELKDKQQEAALSFLKGNQICLPVSLPTGFGKLYQLYRLSLTK